MPVTTPRFYIGCAGWSLALADRPHFPDSGTHLERYAAVFDAVEINSSFYRPHRATTYRRWAESVPRHFRFSLKLPRTLTHEQRLQQPGAGLDDFFANALELGVKLGALLVQLPPSLAFNAEIADVFFAALRDRYGGGVGVEPRHASWFGPEADALLQRHRIARVAADPALNAAAAVPGGDARLRYTRLHGSPRMYYSAYDDAALRRIAKQLHAADAKAKARWCIFDNTAHGHAIPNALRLRELLRRLPEEEAHDAVPRRRRRAQVG